MTETIFLYALLTAAALFTVTLNFVTIEESIRKNRHSRD